MVDSRTRQLAIVANPTKLDEVLETREQLRAQALAAGWSEPLWIETTADDPGVAMTEQALAVGVDLVCALGGDGTVRAVGGALAGSGTPLGLLAAGTGNLLARNLDLPIDDLAGAFAVALGEAQRPIDVGRVQLDGGPAHPFLVIAGAGLDAHMMDRVDDKLKQKVGWLAYAVSGVQVITERSFHVRLTGAGKGRWHRARSVMVCNCGQLQAGFTLVPEALPDDGVLDVLELSPRGALAWIDTLVRLVRRNRDSDNVDHWAVEQVTIELQKPVIAQLDGDATEACRVLRAWTEPGALVVKVPSPELD